MSKYNPLTPQDVANKVTELLNANGSTTTLDIKEALRTDGFWATQSDVAITMYALWSLFGWHWTFNGAYRTYYPDLQSAIESFDEDPTGIEQTSWLGWLDLLATIPTVDDDTEGNAEDGTPTKVSKADLISGSPEETNAPEPGDWVAFSYNMAKPPVYVTGVSLVVPDGVDRELSRLTVRNVVRNFYSELLDVPYREVGANVIRD